MGSLQIIQHKHGFCSVIYQTFNWFCSQIQLKLYYFRSFDNHKFKVFIVQYDRAEGATEKKWFFKMIVQNDRAEEKKRSFSK